MSTVAVCGVRIKPGCGPRSRRGGDRLVHTNVLFEGLSRRSSSGAAVDAWAAGRFVLCASTALALEYEEILTNKFGDAKRPVVLRALKALRPLLGHRSERQEHQSQGRSRRRVAFRCPNPFEAEPRVELLGPWFRVHDDANTADLVTQAFGQLDAEPEHRLAEATTLIFRVHGETGDAEHREGIGRLLPATSCLIIKLPKRCLIVFDDILGLAWSCGWPRTVMHRPFGRWNPSNGRSRWSGCAPALPPTLHRRRGVGLAP